MLIVLILILNHIFKFTISYSNSTLITLVDGKRITGVDIHLPFPFLTSMKAYLGIRYASLGLIQQSKHKTLSSLNNNNNKDESDEYSQSVAPHRFSHSVASFFYESSNQIYAQNELPPVCPQPIHPNLYNWIPRKMQGHISQMNQFYEKQTEDCLTLNIYVPKNSEFE